LDTAICDISFIVAAHNAAPFIAAAVQSALDQKGVTVEVVIVDDGSTDATPDVIASLASAERRIVARRFDVSRGPAAARNAAIDLARGEWLAILDADDLIAPQRSRVLIDLARTLSADVIADHFVRFADGSPPPTSAAIGNGAAFSFRVDVATFLLGNQIFSRTGLGYLKPMLNRRFVAKHRLWHDSTIRIGEDFHLCLDALLAGARFVIASAPLYFYRVRPGSLSWRMKAHDVQRLIEAFSKIEGLPQDARTASAAIAYRRALQRAWHYCQLVEYLKSGALREALRHGLAPGVWQLAGRFGFGALTRRLLKGATA
jgi:succinoglycan biosynthesis protein ExoO